MLLTNRLNFFDKLGNEINLLPDPGILVDVIDPIGAGGGAVFNVYTNRSGNIEVLEIVSSGQNYSSSGTFLRFTNAITGYVWDSSPTNLTINPLTGEITAFTGLSFTGTGDFVPENSNFPYPAVTWKGEMYFDMVSTGLVENQEIFILEKVNTVVDSNKFYHSYPRGEEGPVNTLGFYSNSAASAGPSGTTNLGVGMVEAAIASFTGNVSANDDKVYSLLTTAGLSVGMRIDGPGILTGSTIIEIVNATTIQISNKAVSTNLGGTYEAYVPHGFISGMLIRVGDSILSNPLAGTYTVTNVTDRRVYFSTPNSVPTLPPTLSSPSGFFRAAPVWRGRIVGLEEEIFLFTVSYEEDYPVITKVENVIESPLDVDLLALQDIYYQGGVTISNPAGDLQYRTVQENLEERMLRFHLGFSAGTEGSYIRLFALEDITFPYAPVLISQISLRGEAEDEDPRLARLLQNFGRDVTEQQELILRDSDVNESLPDYRLLNRKRKEMLLQGDQIWPYMGSYKGIVNIVNWFGYYDMRIKEYWLNVNKDDVYYGKYKQIQIPFQLEDRGVSASSIDMMPSKVYKKTNKFGLFYDLNKESGVLDENGVPLTVDSFQFSNEEILIKLFALKQYLVNTFLPLSAKIVDIVGEGVYYERYAANTWNDRVDQFVVDLTRQIDFTAENDRVQIVDAREYDNAAEAFVYEPGLNPLNSFYSTYTINGVTITTPATVPSVPLLSVSTLSGNASPSQIWAGQAFVRGLAGTYVVGVNSNGGLGYLVGDIITLAGGAFTLPIRIRVTGVIPGGVVTNFEILSGLNQGDRYLSLPDSFSQIAVISEDLLTNTYFSGIGTGFQLLNTDIQYQIHAVKTTTIGKGYPVLDTLILNVFNPITSAPYTPVYAFDVKQVNGPKVGYFEQGKDLLALTNEPNVPVAGFLNLEALGFTVTWNEMTFSWNALQGASDALLRAYVDPLPAGSGSVLGLEIVSPGSGYNLTPAIQFVGGGGSGATAVSKIFDGKLQIIEDVVTAAVPLSPTTTRLLLATPFSITNVPYTIGAMVFGEDTSGAQIPVPAVIVALDLVGGTYIDINMFTTNFVSSPGNFTVKIHEGALLITAGSSYVSEPNVKTVGGHTITLYTWDEMGRGNFYEMRWLVNSEPGTTNFIYDSGQKSIDQLINHTVQLPFKGFYRVELIVYDTDNNWINEIKRNYVEAFMPEASAAMITRYVGPSYPPGAPVLTGGTGSQSNILQLQQNCVDTWEEGIFQWDEYWGRWVNPFKTWTTWADCDVEWATLEVTPLSEENNWNYPVAPSYEVYRVSAYDYLVGAITAFNPVTPTVTVTVANTSNRPEVQVGEWVYIKRDSLLYFQAEVTAVLTTLPTVTYTLSGTTAFPQNFLDNPTAWKFYREVENTVVVEDDLYTPGNGKTLVPGQFITLDKPYQTPLNDSRWNLLQPPYHWGIPIEAKVPDPISGADAGIEINSGFVGDPFLTREWVNGQIYQYRNASPTNGYLTLFSPVSSYGPTTVYLERLESPTEENWGNRGMIYINNTAGSMLQTTADPINEIRPGFTIITLLIGRVTNTGSGGGYNWLTPLSQAPLTAAVISNSISSVGNSNFYMRYGSLPSLLGTFTAPTLTTTNVTPPTYFGQGKTLYVQSLNQLWVQDYNPGSFGLVRVYNLTTGIITSLSNGGLGDMVYNPASNEVLIARSTTASGVIRRYNASSLTIAGQFFSGMARNTFMAFDEVNLNLYTTNSLGDFRVIDCDPTSGTYLTTIYTPAPGSLPVNFCRQMMWNPADNAVVCSDSSNASLFYRIDGNTFALTTYNIYAPGLGVTQTANCLLHNPSSNTIWIGLNNVFTNTLASPNYESSIIVIDDSTYTPVQIIDQGIGQTFRTNDLTYDPLRQTVIVASTDSFFSFSLRELGGTVEDFYEGDTIYQQHFRTINMYTDTGNQGHPYDIWNEPTNSEIIAIEVATLDGKKFDEIYEQLSQVSPSTTFAWIEYKYNVFPSRTYFNQSPGNLELYMDFNTRPILGAFENSSAFPANIVDGTGWYYDHAISQGNFAVEVTNVGRFEENPGWTLVTVKDPDNELYQCDSTFLEKARDFDEDYAETHLGVKLVWDEIYNVDWKSLCSQTWGSLDWPYNFYSNYRWFVEIDTNYPHTIRLNEDVGFVVDLSACTGVTADIATRLVSVLNNTFYDPTPSLPGPSIARNENPELTKFNYRIQTVYQDPVTSIVSQGLDTITRNYTWGNPTVFNLFGVSTGLVAGYYQYANFIQPGWFVSAVAPGTVTLIASPSAVGLVPWIPSCVISVDLVNGSKILQNIKGFEADFPQGGWIYDPATAAVIGEFGPGIGAIEENSGFVYYIEMDTAATFTASSYHLEVYPRRSGSVQFINPFLPSGSDIYVYAYAKNPGTAPLGYLRGYYENTPGSYVSYEWWPTHSYDSTFSVPVEWNHSFPLGNYYDWIGNPEIFYGGGLEKTTIQFSQPYRNAQTYIYEGGENRTYSADGGGWYPSITWGSYAGFPDGAVDFGSTRFENLYKPITKVTIFDIAGAPVLDPLGGDLFLILNTWYDGVAIIYTNFNNQPFDFTSASVLNGADLTINLEDVDGDGQSQTFNCVVAHDTLGILANSVAYFSADFTQDLSLVNDYQSFELTNIAGVAPPQAVLYPGMVVGNLTSPLQFQQAFSTKIVEVDDELSTIRLSTPNTLVSGSSNNFYAYSPLEIPFKLQPTNEKVWSRTRQWDSMRLLYDRSFNSAFTWEDTTITLRERKIPIGSSILFTSDASDIAGKTSYKWNLYREDGTKLVTLIDQDFLWTFLETGLYDLELEITDSNGNKQSKYNTNYIEIFLPEQ